MAETIPGDGGEVEFLSKLLDLYEEQKKLEFKKEGLIEYLTKRRINSLSKLIDEEGFPRTDVDPVDIIENRKRLKETEYDLENISKQIEESLVQIHKQKQTKQAQQHDKVSVGSLRPTVRRNSDGTDPYLSMVPFATVEGPVENSPAQVAGLESGDMILRFGHYTEENFPPIVQIRDFVLSQKNKPISILIRRNGNHYLTRIVPMEFDEPGLLGFTMRYLKPRKNK